MLIFDINSIPKGLSIGSWFELYFENIVMYDSNTGSIPFKIDDNNLSLINIHTMDDGEISVLASAVEKILKDSKDEAEENARVFRENNEKLIKYLRSINDEER